MKSIALLHAPEYPCEYTHYPACMEFIEGFTEYGYTISCVSTLDECKNTDIILLSDHKIDINFLNKLNDANPNAVYIIWGHHNILDKIPFRKFIITGEYYHKTPRLDSHKWIDTINKSIPNFVPLMLRANESPSKIGTYNYERTIDGCFMGSPYKPDWVNSLSNIIYHDITRGGFLDYNTRRETHLRSRIAFGFSHEGNIANYHPTQRIFEGLAYGCVVISDNEAAHDLTSGIVEYAATKKEFLEKYNYYLTHPEECRKKELEGYEWAKKFGTNRYSASLFLNKMKELGFISE